MMFQCINQPAQNLTTRITDFSEEVRRCLKPSAYITRVRIEKGMQLLQETRLKIYDIAEICGYNETKYFVSIFKKNTGFTPGEYRAIVRDPSEDALSSTPATSMEEEQKTD